MVMELSLDAFLCSAGPKAGTTMSGAEKQPVWATECFPGCRSMNGPGVPKLLGWKMCVMVGFPDRPRTD